MIPRLRRAGAELATLGFFGVLAGAWWWPLPLHLTTRQLEAVPVDSAYNQWIIGWGVHALTSDPFRYFQANAYHPHTDVLAWGDHLFALAVLAVPLVAIAGVVGAYNLLLLASSALTGYATNLLARELGASRAAGALGGVFAAFTAMRVLEHGHLQVLVTPWVPLVLLFAERTRRTRSWRDAFALAGVTAGLLATNVYLSIFTALAVAIWLAVTASFRDVTKPALVRLAAAGLAAGALCLPLYLPSIRVRQAADIARPLDEQSGATVEAFDPRPPPGVPAQLLSEAVDRPLHPPEQGLVPPENYATPGLLLLATLVTSAGFLLVRRRSPPARALVALGGVAAFAALASFGPAITWRGRDVLGANPAFHVPYRLLPGYDALRVPMRWLLVASIALGAFTALVATPALRALRPRAARVLLVVAIAAGVVVEQSGAPWTLGRAARIGDHPSLEWLDETQADDVVVVELPITGDVSSAVTQQIEARRLLLSTSHLRRRVNGGISPYIPATYGDRVEVVNRLGRDPRALRYLREWGVDLVFFEPADQARYADRMRSPAEVEAELDALDGLRRVRTFPDAIVYRVER